MSLCEFCGFFIGRKFIDVSNIINISTSPHVSRV